MFRPRFLLPNGIAFLLLLLLGTSDPLPAQELDGRSRIALLVGFGFRSESSVGVSAGGVETVAGGSGVLGGLGWTRWLDEGRAVTLSASVISVDSSVRTGVSGSHVRSAQVIPLMVGLAWYLPVEPDTGVRPFGAVEVGPVLGVESRVSSGVVNEVGSYTRGAFGGRLGVGVDFLWGHRFTVGLGGGYRVMTDFSDPVGGRRNHSAPDFTLSLGLLFGEAR